MDAPRVHSIPRNVHMSTIVRQKHKPRFPWVRSPDVRQNITVRIFVDSFDHVAHLLCFEANHLACRMIAYPRHASSVGGDWYQSQPPRIRLLFLELRCLCLKLNCLLIESSRVPYLDFVLGFLLRCRALSRRFGLEYWGANVSLRAVLPETGI